MDGFLRQSTATTIKFGPLFDHGDARTPETALVIQKADVRLSKNGAAMAAATANQGASDAGAPHDAMGQYDLSLATADTDTAGLLRVSIQKAGALIAWQDYLVLPQQVFDSWVAGTDLLQVDTTAWDDAALPTIPTAAAVADAVWDEAASGHTTAGTFGFYLDAQVSDLTVDVDASVIADAVWDEARSGHTTAGTFGYYLDSRISTVSADVTPVTVVTDKLNTMLELDPGGVNYRFTTDAADQVKLAPDGLDAVAIDEPTGVATTFREMLVQLWCRFFRPVRRSSSDLKIRTYASDASTVRTEQAYSDSAGVEFVGDATDAP